MSTTRTTGTWRTCLHVALGSALMGALGAPGSIGLGQERVDATATPPPTPPSLTLDAVRARIGVASMTPALLPTAFASLPIGFYKDYHALGRVHLRADWAEWAGLGEDTWLGQPYLPVIQYKAFIDTPEIQSMLRLAASSGQFPTPAGVDVEELLSLLELSGLEDWLVKSAQDGSLPRGTRFLLGNEPGYKPNHDPRTPEQIVEDARLVREIFERHELGHELALGGISSPDNAYNRQVFGTTGLAFFEAILKEAGRRDVSFDAFAIHPYAASGLDEPADYRNPSNPEALARDSVEQIRAFRTIMRRHGQRDKDLIVGEIGLPFPADGDNSELVCEYADRILTWCLTATDAELGHRGDGNRLVQRFTWFLLAEPGEPTPGVSDHPVFDFERSVLLAPEGDLTELGKTFNAVAERIAR